eukprot:1719879-Pyramimonas_sp.AAC.1
MLAIDPHLSPRARAACMPPPAHQDAEHIREASHCAILWPSFVFFSLMRHRFKFTDMDTGRWPCGL